LNANKERITRTHRIKNIKDNTFAIKSRLLLSNIFYIFTLLLSQNIDILKILFINSFIIIIIILKKNNPEKKKYIYIYIIFMQYILFFIKKILVEKSCYLLRILYHNNSNN